MAGTTAVSSAGSTTAAQSSTDNALGAMDSDMFLKLLVSQMKYQNPMSPSDPTAMLAQVAQYAQVEALNKMTTLQASGNALTEAQTATDLIGKTVTASDAKGDISGKVTAARFTDTGPILVLDSGAEISLSAIGRVDASTTAAAAATTATTDTTTPTDSSTSSTDAAAATATATA